ncbi:glycosyltransferase, partial [bacterium]|nr:glycosyltransferase [bacterium]
ERDEIRHQYGLNGDDFVVLATSDKSHSGNYGITAGALAVVRKQNPSTKLLYIAEAAMCDCISRTAKEMNVGAAVKTAQLESPEKLAELFRIADVPMLTDTGNGTIQLLKEAMASSLPVILKNSSHFKGIVLHEHNGICCKTLDEYAQAMDRLQNDPDLHELLAVNGLETAHHYTLAKQGKLLETCYQKTFTVFKSRQNKPKNDKKKYHKKRPRK